MSVIQHSLDLSSFEHCMLWAACCLGFFGFLRAGEFTVNSAFDPATHLTLQDLQVDSMTNPSCIRVSIKCSKTDPFRKGCVIYLGRGRSICPLVAIMAYLNLRGPAPGPLFIHQNGLPLTCQQLSAFLSEIMSAAGIPGTLSGHMFRIGAATSAAQQGIPDHLIKTLGRWSSDAYQLYVRMPIATLINMAGQLL